jgi:hypothetical protein
MIKYVFSSLSFITRHTFAFSVSVFLPLLLLIITYFVLLLGAILFNKGIGSPVALPFWVLIQLLVCSSYTALFLFPSVALAELVTFRLSKWQHLYQIPLASIVMLFITYLAAFALSFLHLAKPHPLAYFVEYPFRVFLLLSIPLGLYFWSMKLVQAGLYLPAFLYNWLLRFRKKTNAQ